MPKYFDYRTSAPVILLLGICSACNSEERAISKSVLTNTASNNANESRQQATASSKAAAGKDWLDGELTEVQNYYLITPSSPLLLEAVTATLINKNATNMSITPEGSIVANLTPEQFDKVQATFISDTKVKIEPFLVFDTKDTLMPTSDEGETDLIAKDATPLNLSARSKDSDLDKVKAKLDSGKQRAINRNINQNSHTNSKTSLQLTETTDGDENNSQALDESLPNLIDNSLSKYFPPIANRGIHRADEAFSAGYYNHSYLQARIKDFDLRSGDKTKICSPAFIYSLAGFEKNSGGAFTTTIHALSEFGCAPLSISPYSASGENPMLPSETAFIAGIYSREEKTSEISSYLTGMTRINLARATLAQGNLILATVEEDSNFRNFPNGPWQSKGVITEATHVFNRKDISVIIVGYDDNKAYVSRDKKTQRGAFLFANSRGTGWGVGNTLGAAGKKGYFWLGYNELNTGLVTVFTMWPNDSIKKTSKFVATGNMHAGDFNWITRTDWVPFDTNDPNASGSRREMTYIYSGISGGIIKENTLFKVAVDLDYFVDGTDTWKEFRTTDLGNKNFARTLKMLNFESYQVRDNLKDDSDSASEYADWDIFGLHVDLSSEKISNCEAAPSAANCAMPATRKPGVNPTATVTSKATAAPTATVTPKATAAPKATVTPKATAAPKATVTP